MASVSLVSDQIPRSIDLLCSSRKKAWVHENIEMRYDPKYATFYKDVNDDGEKGHLYYQWMAIFLILILVSLVRGTDLFFRTLLGIGNSFTEWIP